MPKIALVIPTNLWFCPYVDIYTDILKSNNHDYDIICWDRDGKDTENAIRFKHPIGKTNLSKLKGYYDFSRFVKSVLKKNEYSKVIIFTSQVGIFLSSFLKKNFQDNYIFDFRDLSIEQNPFFRFSLKKLLRNSFANVISSPGFKKCLPSNIHYYLSHNFNIHEAEKALCENSGEFKINPINVLTIGGIRDYSSNVQIIDALGNNDDYRIDFIGRGTAAPILQQYSQNKSLDNVYFKGYYEKKDEPQFLDSATFLNIYYPDTIVHKTAMSNRFYNSIIYRRPMIVTKGQIQGEYCDKYNLGLAIETVDGLGEKIKRWIVSNDYSEYQKRCISLLKQFINDYQEFRKMLLNFAN